jgi:hypothetical protein
MPTRASKSPGGPPILLLPPFETTEDLTEVLCKLAWYAAPYLTNGLRFLGLTCGDVAVPAEPYIRKAIFDSRVPIQMGAIAERILLLPLDDLPGFLSGPDEPSCIIWDARQFRAFLKNHKDLRDRLRHRPMVLIDKVVNPFESFQLPHFFQREFGSLPPPASLSSPPSDDHDRFLRFLDAVRRRPDSGRCNVYGGGYSLFDLADDAIPPGVAVLCNAVITQHDLIRRVDPVAVAITDPLLAGCSRYGEMFRDELVRFMATTDAWVFTLNLYAPYYRAILPEDSRARVVGMPVRYGDFPPETVNLDFAAEFVCVDSWNVVTTLSIPLATTIADEVGLLGLDGIDPARPDVYNSISIYDQHNSIGRLHGQLPGNIDAAYNRRHAQALTLLIRAGKARGKRFEAITPSHYPVLRELYGCAASSSGNSP